MSKPKAKVVQEQSIKSKEGMSGKPGKNSFETKKPIRPLKAKEVQEQLNSSGSAANAAPALTVEYTEVLKDREAPRTVQAADDLENRAWAEGFMQATYEEFGETEQVEQSALGGIVPEALSEIYGRNESKDLDSEPVIDELDYYHNNQEAGQLEQLITLEIDENVVSFVKQAETALEEAEPEVIVRAEVIFNEIESIIIESEPSPEETIEHTETVGIDTEETKLTKIILLVTELSETLNLHYTEEEIAVIAASLLEVRQKLQRSSQPIDALPEEKGTREFKLSSINMQRQGIKKSLEPTHSLLGFIALAKKIELQLQLKNLSKATSI